MTAPGPRIWLARIAALVALAAAAVAIALAISAFDGTGEISGADAQAAMRQLSVANRALGERLEALAPGASPRDAQQTARSTAALARRLDDHVDGEGDLADRVHAVLRAELDYLDAVGSTLNNPRSPLRGRIGERAQALRDVLQHVPGGDHRAVRGGLALVRYSEARVSR